VGTSFIMGATPLIRYRTGDFAVLKGQGCPSCGRPYQVWERIEGREQEFIVTAAGRHISLTSLHFHDDTLKDIAQFQFRQARPGRVMVCYVLRDGHGLDEEKFLSRLRVKLGDNLKIILQKVDYIPPTPRGKRLLSIREVADGK